MNASTLKDPASVSVRKGSCSKMMESLVNSKVIAIAIGDHG